MDQQKHDKHTLCLSMSMFIWWYQGKGFFGFYCVHKSRPYSSLQQYCHANIWRKEKGQSFRNLVKMSEMYCQAIYTLFTLDFT